MRGACQISAQVFGGFFFFSFEHSFARILSSLLVSSCLFLSFLVSCLVLTCRISFSCSCADKDKDNATWRVLKDVWRSPKFHPFATVRYEIRLSRSWPTCFLFLSDVNLQTQGLCADLPRFSGQDEEKAGAGVCDGGVLVECEFGRRGWSRTRREAAREPDAVVGNVVLLRGFPGGRSYVVPRDLDDRVGLSRGFGRSGAVAGSRGRCRASVR